MEFKLPYPISANTYWRKTNRGIVYLSPAGQKYKDIVIKNYKFANKPSDALLAMEIIIHPVLTKKGLPSKKLIDIDNGNKCILDSMIGIFYIDDKQIKDLHIKYGEPVSKGAVTIKINNFIKD